MLTHDKRIIHGSAESRWRTPPELFQALDETFDFLIDGAADESNHLCESWFGPGGMSPDAIAADWSFAMRQTAQEENPRCIYPEREARRSAIFFNPPYSKTEIKKLKEAGATPDDPRIRALKIENWAEKAYCESQRGVSSVGLLPYSPQTFWFRRYVMGHTVGEVGKSIHNGTGWAWHAALDYWRLPHRVSYLAPDGSPSNNAGVNSCVVIWGPNPGFVGPWVPSGRYWSYR